MFEQNKKIIKAHLEGNKEGAINALKKLLNTPESELFDKSKFNFSSNVLKYKVLNRED